MGANIITNIKGPADPTQQILTSMNTKLMVDNFPATHTKEMISKICQVFGKVKSIDLLKDPSTGEFRGQVHVEYETEQDAKKGYNGMLGLKVERRERTKDRGLLSC